MTVNDFWNQWGKIILGGLIGSGGALAGAFALIKIFFEGKIKRSLDSHAEILKHDLQKQMIHAELVTKNKHKYYSKLFELINIADGSISALSGVRRVSTFQEYDRGDFEEYLKQNDVKSNQREIILRKWDISKEAGVAEWRKYENVLLQNDAEKALREARNFNFLKAIYISQVVEKESEEIFKLLRELLTFRVLPEGLDQRDRDRIREITTLIPKSIEQLKNTMKNEIGFS